NQRIAVGCINYNARNALRRNNSHLGKHTVPAAAVNRKIIVFPVYGVIYYLATNKSIYLATAKCVMDSAERRSGKSAFTINLLQKHFVLKYQLVVNLLELKVRGAFINITGSP